MTSLTVSYDDDWIVVRAAPPRSPAAVLRRMLKGASGGPQSIDSLADATPALSFALAELKMIADQQPDGARIDAESVRMRHRVAASLDGDSARALGLPPLVDLTFRTDVEGALGTASFRLRHEWSKFGLRQNPRRVGAVLRTEDGDRRLPLWLLEAVEVAEAFVPGTDLGAHWEALARFRRALDPGVEMAAEPTAAKVSMTDFLQGLEVRLADSFGIAPRPPQPAGPDEKLLDFDPVPFCRPNLEAFAEDELAERHGELRGDALSRFQDRVRTRGSLPAYRVGDGSYLVIEGRARTVLDVMARKQRASASERDAFVRNPRAAISDAVEARLRSDGELDDLSPESEQEAIERAAGPAFIETLEYSTRVIGLTVYRDPGIESWESSGMEWLPEADREDPGHGDRVVSDESSERADSQETQGPVVLDTRENFIDLGWTPRIEKRDGAFRESTLDGIVTELKDHQKVAVEWQIRCWSAGLPGVLNADEQGLGKTLQTIAFVRWLQDHMDGSEPKRRGPVLVVAPTTLLPTWEAEVERHTDSRGLGQAIRLYGSALGGYKSPGARGVDTREGQAKLDLGILHTAVAEGRGHRFWVLTTYTTLTNYQHSLARIPFAVTVFDEIQALKNPASLRSFAARAVQSDFRIGLTGTPIENRTADLWAVLDQLTPGLLGSLAEFQRRYAVPDESNMGDLHARVFRPSNGLPGLALRRTKEQVARELPEKARRLHPRLMPQGQATAYDAVGDKLAAGRGALQALHHIRSVSAHPDLVGYIGEDFVADSARLRAVFDVLHDVRRLGERALVFIDHRRVQYRFVELARREFGLPRIDVINGDTPIHRRQAIVERFQRHLDADGGFDLLVLGPRAAGTGLTLTAATHVVHASRWWNPAVEEQCNDRVHRIGQDRPVTVHVPMAIHPERRERSFDCLLHNLMNRKRRLASAALWPMGDTAAEVAELRRELATVTSPGDGDPLARAMAAMFDRDGKAMPPFAADGSLAYD